MWRLDRDKAQLHRFQHQIAYRRAADSGAGHRMPSKHFPVMGIDDEDDADDLPPGPPMTLGYMRPSLRHVKFAYKRDGELRRKRRLQGAK